VELTTSPNGESESTLTSRKLHGKVLVILRQVGVDLLVLPVRCRGGARGVVYRGPDSQRHAVAALLDEVDDVAVVEGVDVHVVHRQDAVSHL